MQTLPDIDRPAGPRTGTAPPEAEPHEDPARRYVLPDVHEVPQVPRHDPPEDVEW
jgi:hypothetical protein